MSFLKSIQANYRIAAAKNTLREWYKGKDQKWFNDNLTSIVDIDAELKYKGKDKSGFPYYQIGNSNDRFYPTDTSDVIQLDNGEEYSIEG